MNPNPIAMTLPSFPKKRCVLAALCLFLVSIAPLTAQSLKKVKFEKLDRFIEMSKSPCYGRCPVFRLTVYDKGIVSYEGERNTPRLGLYAKRLDKVTYDNLLATFQQVNLWQFKDVYRGEYADAPTVSISYYEEGDNKTIIGKDGRPTKVLELEALLDDIGNSQGWELIRAAESGLPDNIISDELIVQLHNGKGGREWARKYRKQEMEMVESIAPDTNYWLFRYNPEVVPPEQMLARVRGDSEVIGAEFNKKLERRVNN